MQRAVRDEPQPGLPDDKVDKLGEGGALQLRGLTVAGPEAGGGVQVVAEAAQEAQLL